MIIQGLFKSIYQIYSTDVIDIPDRGGGGEKWKQRGCPTATTTTALERGKQDSGRTEEEKNKFARDKRLSSSKKAPNSQELELGVPGPKGFQALLLQMRN